MEKAPGDKGQVRERLPGHSTHFSFAGAKPSPAPGAALQAPGQKPVPSHLPPSHSRTCLLCPTSAIQSWVRPLAFLACMLLLLFLGEFLFIEIKFS